jgi:hypothetical protein
MFLIKRRRDIMALNLPSFLMPLIFQLLAVVPGLIQQAEGAFAGHGTGDLKKQFVLDSAMALLASMGTVKPGMVTPQQSKAIMATVSEIIDAIVSALNTAKLFETPTV